MDVLAPKEKSSGKFVLYIHGGGFVSVHRGVLNHSITPLVRAGFTVFSIDYPLAPKYRYPSPVVSVLKCLAYIREHYGVSHVQVLGDSAGGCIASMSVAAACNPEGRWHPKVRECLKQHEFPRIEGVALLYSICDVSSWTQRSCNSIGSWCLRAIILVCLALYKSESDDKITLLENIDKVTSFPRTFLLCGHNDILDVSHAALAEALHEKGTHTTTMVLPGFHGFHGLPVPFSLGSWRRTVYPANCALIQWLCNGSDSRVPALPKWSFAEFNLHLPIVLAVLHVVPVYVAWCCL
jgi:acetyl esterase/lipase